MIDEDRAHLGHLSVGRGPQELERLELEGEFGGEDRPRAFGGAERGELVGEVVEERSPQHEPTRFELLADDRFAQRSALGCAG